MFQFPVQFIFQNIFHSNKCITGYAISRCKNAYWPSAHIQCPLFWLDFNVTWVVL